MMHVECMVYGGTTSEQATNQHEGKEKSQLFCCRCLFVWPATVIELTTVFHARSWCAYCMHWLSCHPSEQASEKKTKQHDDEQKQKKTHIEENNQEKLLEKFRSKGHIINISLHLARYSIIYFLLAIN